MASFRRYLRASVGTMTVAVRWNGSNPAPGHEIAASQQVATPLRHKPACHGHRGAGCLRRRRRRREVFSNPKGNNRRGPGHGAGGPKVAGTIGSHPAEAIALGSQPSTLPSALTTIATARIAAGGARIAAGGRHPATLSAQERFVSLPPEETPGWVSEKEKQP